MNLYETEALTIDPESRGGESTAADVFFSLFFCSLPIWVHKCAWCLFFTESLCPTEKEKNKQGGIKTSGCSALSISCLNLSKLSCTRRQLHEHFNRDQEKLRGKRERGRLLIIISCQAAFQEMVNLWDHDTS